MAAYEEQEYHKPFRLKVWAKMLSFFNPYKKYFAITLGLNIFLAGVDVLTPRFRAMPLIILSCRIHWMESIHLPLCILV